MNRCSLLALLLAISPLAGCQATTPQAPSARIAPVYLLAGQSNMEGVGRVSKLRQDVDLPPQVALFHSDAIGAVDQHGRWGPLRPAGWSGGSVPHFGVEIPLGRALAARDEGSGVYLIKHAVSGTSLVADWDADDGPHSTKFEGLAAAALNDLMTRGLRPEVRGVFWIQGEADARHEASARAYCDNLERLVSKLRETYGRLAPGGRPERIRVVVAQVLPDGTPGAKAALQYPHRGTVRAAQRAIGKHVPNVVPVETGPDLDTHATEQDGYRDDDNVHMNAAGVTKLGRAMARAMLQDE